MLDFCGKAGYSMEIFTRLGIFLFLFGLIMFGMRFFLSKRTRRELNEIRNPVPAYFQTQTRMMVRLIIVVVLITLGLYIILSSK